MITCLVDTKVLSFHCLSAVISQPLVPDASAMPEDYTAVNIPLTFAVGATTASFTLQVTDDNLVEPNEIFNLKLVKNPSTLPDCVLVADDLADVIITDDDCKWRLSLLSMIFIYQEDMVAYW